MLRRRTHASLLVADNKDIADLLHSHAVFTRQRLREIARRRGILLSRHDTREDLIAYVSLLSFDRKGLDELLDAAAPAERHTPFTLRQYPVECEPDELVRLAESVRDERAERHDEVAQARRVGATVLLHITYTELDASRTRLQQKRDREVFVEFERVGGCLQVRATPNQKAEIYIDAIIAKAARSEAAPVARTIDFSGIRVPAIRTKFFLQLLQEMRREYSNVEVTDVRVHRLLEVDDDGETENGESPRHVGAAVASELRNASLEGTNVLTTPTYRSLERAGYFISRLLWSAHDKSEADAVFEAWFNDGPNCNDFRYRVRPAAGAGRPSSTDPQRKQWLTSLEQAARVAYENVTTEQPGDDTNPESRGGSE